MLKHFFTTCILLFLFNCSYGQVQSGKVIYKVRNDINIDKVMKKIPKSHKVVVRRWIHRVKTTVPYLRYHLNFNTNEGRFKRVESMRNDNGLDLERTSISVGGNGTFYTNLKEGITQKQILDFLNRDWRVTQQIDHINWQITDDTKIIQGYKCVKATTSSIYSKNGEIVAWFAPQLPFHFGPLSYTGLPGLILALKGGKDYFYAIKVRLSEKPKKIKRPDKGKVLSPKEFIQTTDKLTQERRKRR